MAEKKRNLYRNIGISLGIVIAVIIVIIIAMNAISSTPSTPTPTSTPSQNPTLAPTATSTSTPAPTIPPILVKPSWVNVSGTVSPYGSVPITVVFHSLKTQEFYYVDVSKVGASNIGYYSILLPNQDSYQVYSNYWGGMGGSDSLGTLNVNTYNNSITQNWNTPVR